MRDRLIELINEAEKQERLAVLFGDIDSIIDTPRGAEFAADYLLANGVIVSPVKVGQTVYIISRNKIKMCEVVYVGLSLAEGCCSFNFVENYTDGTFRKTHSALFAQIGVRVFLTREEAEAALKGGAKE